jgi:hypothetical protein
MLTGDDYMHFERSYEHFSYLECDRRCPLLVKHLHLRCRHCSEQYALNLATFQPVTSMRLHDHAWFHELKA